MVIEHCIQSILCLFTKKLIIPKLNTSITNDQSYKKATLANLDFLHVGYKWREAHLHTHKHKAHYMYKLCSTMIVLHYHLFYGGYTTMES